MPTRTDLELSLGQALVRGDLVGALDLLTQMEAVIDPGEVAALHRVRVQMLQALFREAGDSSSESGQSA